MLKRDWRAYQDRVAEVFRSLGASVEVEHVLRGARAEHEIDVYVSFERWGVSQSWIVECKLHRRAITKAHILTLKSILEDVGADRGLLVSERGFQPGAVAASAKSNISLTSLGELQAVSRPEVLGIVAASLEHLTLELLRGLRTFIYGWEDCSKEERELVLAVEDHLAQKRRYSRESSGKFSTGVFGDDEFYDDGSWRGLESQFGRMFLNANVDLQAFMSVFIDLAILRTGFDRVKLNQFPVKLKQGQVPDLDDFVKAAQDSTARARDWIRVQNPRPPGSDPARFGTIIGEAYYRWLI